MSSPLSASIESILDRFDEAWNGPTPPRIEDYLASGPPAQRLALLVELVRIDLERRLARGERIRLEETYLPRFPELQAHRSSVVTLAACEFALRRRREPDLSPAEYFERFPQYGDELMRVLSSHPTRAKADSETGECRRPPAGPAVTRQRGSDACAFLSPPQAADEIGRLAHYRILKELGEGGMGVVFLAEDTQLGRTVALKTMRPEIAADPQYRQRFLREARAAAKVEDDHIVPIYAVGEDNGVPWLAMPFLKGQSLSDLLKQRQVLQPAQAVRLGIHMAKGLAAAHAAGLIHRDVKPGNIWIEPEGGGRAKLLDFGLARDLVAQRGQGEQLTVTGAVVGTPGFMAPEQANGEALDARADLFSLGCVLYRMVTGRLPFPGQGMMDMLRALATQTPPAPHEVQPTVPQPLSALIMQLLAKDRSARPASAAAVVQALAALQVQPTSSVSAVPPETPAAAPTPRPARRRWVPALLVALVLFGITALMAAIIIRIRSQDGRDTTIEVPEGSKVTIEEKGRVTVAPAEASNAERKRAGAKQGREDAKAAPPAEGTEPLGPWALVRHPARLRGVRRWTVETRLGRGTFSAVLRPDGRQLAVHGMDGVTRLYDPATGRLQQVLHGQGKVPIVATSYSNLSWSPDNKHLAVCYGDGTLHVWNVETTRMVHSVQLPGEGRVVAWSPDGKLLAYAQQSGNRLYDTATWQEVSSFPKFYLTDTVAMVWSPDSKKLAIGYPGGTQVREVPSGKLLHQFEGFKWGVVSLAWSPDGNTLVVAEGETPQCRCYDAHSGKLLRTLEVKPCARSAAFSPDGKILAVGTGWEESSIKFFETGSWKRLRQVLVEFWYPISKLTWSADGTLLAACREEGIFVSIFDAHTGKETRRINFHWSPVQVAWSADGKKLSMACLYDGARIWDVSSGSQLLRQIHGYARFTAWSPNGASLAILGDVWIVQYDAASGLLLRSLTDEKLVVRTPPAWSPDGKWIATIAKNDKDKQIQ